MSALPSRLAALEQRRPTHRLGMLFDHPAGALVLIMGARPGRPSRIVMRTEAEQMRPPVELVSGFVGVDPYLL